MKQQPILFSKPMVEAIIVGRKTETRRTITPHRSGICAMNKQMLDWSDIMPNGNFGIKLRELADPEIIWRVGTPYQPGDMLWVRETYFQQGHWEKDHSKIRKSGRQAWKFVPANDEILFADCVPQVYRKGRHAKDPETVAWHKRLGRFMPKKYARIWLHVENCYAERVQDISERAAIAEGIEPMLETLWKDYLIPTQTALTPRQSFKTLWSSINDHAPEQGKLDARWDANPWVWVTRFTRIENLTNK